MSVTGVHRIPVRLALVILTGAVILACGGGTGPHAANPTGALVVTIAGLPSGTSARVTVSASGATIQTLTGTSTLDNLVPGQYTVAASVVAATGNTFTPTPASQSVTVNANASASATVTYAATMGTLVVAVGGLPSGVNAGIRVTGPNGYATTVAATSTLASIPVGAFQLALTPIAQGAVTWYPDATSYGTTVAGAAVTTVHFYYGPMPMTGAYVPELVAFDSVMIAYMTARSVPAGTLAVGHNGVTYMTRGYGWLDQAHTQPVPLDALFRLASVSKPLTYEAIESLIAAGKVSASDAVYPLLGITPLSGATVDPRIYTITVQNLIDHKGGWDDQSGGAPDWVFQSRTVATQMGLTAPPTKYQLAQFMMGQPLQHDPGTVYAYSNFGYSLLGLVIEHASGQPYFTYLHQAILDPIGATDVHLAESLVGVQNPREPYYSDPGTNCSVFAIATCTTVPEAYGGFYIEAFDSFGGMTASAPTLMMFLQHYFIYGPVVQPGYVWDATFYGSLPGTSTMVRQRTDNTDIVTLFDQRTDPSGLSYDQQAIFDSTAAAITVWPSSQNRATTRPALRRPRTSPGERSTATP